MGTSVAPTAPPTSPSVGEVLEGRYRLEGELGAGGVGQVFRATHLRLGHSVAIKMLHETFVHSAQMRPRFLREAQALGALKHPHIVTLTDFGVAGERPYIVMELLEGRSLRAELEHGPLPPARAARITRRILDALAFAHARGFVHRDLKPDNVFLLDLPNDDAFPKLLDFGFVKLTEETGPTLPQGDAAALTRSGITFGTPAYMSPEQASGAPADARSDLYALGVVLFEMLCGRRPFEGTLPEIVRQHITAPLPTFKARGALARESPMLRAALERATAKEPRDRYPSAEAMREALDALGGDWLRAADSGVGPAPSGEAPTVAAVPASKKVARRRGALGPVLAAFGVCALVGGVAVGVATLGSWGEEEDAAPPAMAAGGAAEGSANEGAGRATGDPSADGPAGAAPSGDAPSGDEAGGGAARSDELGGGEASGGEASGGEASGGEASGDEVGGETSGDGARSDASESGDEASGALDPSRSPWRTHRAVGLLSRTRRRVLRGGELSSANERGLKRFVRSHRDDPRPHLLLAQGYANRGWATAALQRYDLALRVDEEARHDPRMIRDLVALAADSSVQGEASARLHRLYGAAARPAVVSALGEATDPEVRARLEALRDAL